MTTNSNDNPINKIETIDQAQTDMCKSYANGSVGIIASGIMWLISAIIVSQMSTKQGIWALLIGGMFIHPLSILLGKLLGVSGAHTKGNPLGNLAMESTILMLLCIPLAVGLSLSHPAWFFQGMLMIIGGRYLTFATIYGKKQYWILGALLGIASFLLLTFNAQPFSSALSGSVIEIVFGVFMYDSFRKA
jgi:hypothetical protein